MGSLHWSPTATLDHRTASGSHLVARLLFGSGWSQAEVEVEVEAVLSESE